MSAKKVTDEEIENEVERLAAESRQEYKDTDQKAPKGKFIVEHNIKENGKAYNKGDDYTGKNENRYLANKQIRKKD